MDDALLTFAGLRDLALTAGFDDVAVTDAVPHDAAARLFAGWLEKGYQADMGWLEREPERRSTPQRLLPTAASVLTLAVSYNREVAPAGPGRGRVARYAAGEDYHRVIDRQLKALIQALQARLGGGSHYRFYVDYGPVLERAFAERAGLGFIGRSANLIHPTFGTYVFLSTIITDARIESTPARPGTCGGCRRCLDVCPTGALESPHVIDARKCISYLTIENRGPIPRHMRRQIGHWLFGCDLCQEVCPYNQRAAVGAGVNPAIAVATVAGVSLDVAEILALREEAAFAARFRLSPLKRARREGLLRNAAVVAGNLGEAALVPALASAAREDASALVRGHALWALAELGRLELVRAARPNESDPFVLSEIEAALPA